MYQKIVLLFFISAGLSCIKQSTIPFSTWSEPYTGMVFVLIPKGDFLMGSHEPSGKEKLHKVTISKNFWMGQMEVTQDQWQSVMGNKERHPEKPSPFRNIDPNYPVVSVSYYEVQKFLDRLNELSKTHRFRLPTEAEWEYACRAGTTSAFSYGPQLSDTLANFNAEIPSKYVVIGKYPGHPVKTGSYPPNPWNLYNMHGNVWEWVSDWHAPYSLEESIDPKGPSSGDLKIIRGGSWYFGAGNAKSSTRRSHAPDLWGFSIGFRVVCEERGKR